MGSIPEGFRLRKNGTWECRFYHNGVRHSVYGGTLRECKDKHKAMVNKLEKRLAVNKQNITLHEYYNEWRERRELRVKPATLYKNDKDFTRIDKIIGKLRVSEIEGSDIHKVQRELAKKLTTRGVNTNMALLRSIMKSAVADDIIIKNPTLSVMPLGRTEEEDEKLSKQHRQLSESEIDIFFRYAEKSHYRLYCLFLLLTGMRAGEAAALTWGDIDTETRTIHITKTVTRISDKEFQIGTTKTKGSKRDIVLSDEVQTVLQEQLIFQSALFGIAAVKKAERIFTTTKGGLITQHTLSPVIKNICMTATANGEPLEVFASHTFRATYINRSITAGIPYREIAKQVGHTKTTTIQTYYEKANDEDVRAAAERVSEGIGKLVQIRRNA